MSRHNHNLPENVIPEGDICVPLFIPDDTDYVNLVIRALRQLTLDRHYKRDDANTAIVVREQFHNRMYSPFVDALQNATPCESENGLGVCFRMDTSTEAFEFYPNDPFLDPDNQDGQLILSGLRWVRWADFPVNNLPLVGDLIQDVLGFATGYFDNDIFITVDTLNLFTTPITNFADIIGAFTNFWLPYFKVEMEGSGQLEIELVNVPLGGAFILIPDLSFDLPDILDTIIDFFDNDGTLPPSWIFTEVNRDLISVPPELVATQVQEFEFNEDGVHTLHGVFVPQLDDEFPFIFPFGGVREIEACGSLKIVGSQTGTIIDKSNFKQADIARNGVIAVSTVQDICEGVVCAMEKVAQRILLSSDFSNIRDNVEVDIVTGEIVIKDDPLDIGTPVTSTSQQRASGSAFFQAQMFNKLFVDLNARITDNFGAATIKKLIAFTLNVIETVNLDAFVDAYIVDDPGTTVNVPALAEQIFCTGNFYTGVSEYAISLSNEETLNRLIDLSKEIPQQTVNKWADEGSTIPRDDYLGYGCTLRPNQTFTIDVVDGTVHSQLSVWDFPGDRLVKVAASGTISFPGGERLDARYEYDSSGAIIGDAFNLFRFSGLGGLLNLLAPDEIVFQSDGSASWIIEIPAGTTTNFNYRTIKNYETAIGVPSGSISITIGDIGEA